MVKKNTSSKRLTGADCLRLSYHFSMLIIPDVRALAEIPQHNTAKFENMTAKFLPISIIDTAKINDKTGQLILQSELNIPRGNYTIEISASDEAVIKSTLLDLLVEK